MFAVAGVMMEGVGLVERILSASILIAVLMFLVLVYHKYLRELFEAYKSLIDQLTNVTRQLQDLKDEIYELVLRVREFNGKAKRHGE